MRVQAWRVKGQIRQQPGSVLVARRQDTRGTGPGYSSSTQRGQALGIYLPAKSPLHPLLAGSKADSVEKQEDLKCRQLCFSGAGALPGRRVGAPPHFPSEQPEGPPGCPLSSSSGSELLVPGSVSDPETHGTQATRLS